ncbi:MAG: hypothetical protein WA642_22520 [Steroidobacteraceae bacterium]
MSFRCIFARGAGILREVLNPPFELSFVQPFDLWRLIRCGLHFIHSVLANELYGAGAILAYM